DHGQSLEGGRSIPRSRLSPLDLETISKRLRKGDSPILLRRLRKIGTVPGRFEIVSQRTISQCPFAELGKRSRRVCEASSQLRASAGRAWPSIVTDSGAFVS